MTKFEKIKLLFKTSELNQSKVCAAIFEYQKSIGHKPMSRGNIVNKLNETRAKFTEAEKDDIINYFKKFSADFYEKVTRT